MTFEAVVARIVADFLERFDQTCERAWIAEAKETSEFLGSIMLVKDPSDRTTALLRTLLVEKSARGIGLGYRLIEECVAFGKAKGYARITLGTYSFLEEARRLYLKAGFQLRFKGEATKRYGKMMVPEVWDIELCQ